MANQVTLGLNYVWHAGLKNFANGGACVPRKNYIANTGPNKLARLLSTNQCCLVVDHRQGGKTTLAALAAKELDNCYVVLLEALKVAPNLRIDLHMRRVIP